MLMCRLKHFIALPLNNSESAKGKWWLGLNVNSSYLLGRKSLYFFNMYLLFGLFRVQDSMFTYRWKLIWKTANNISTLHPYTPLHKLHLSTRTKNPDFAWFSSLSLRNHMKLYLRSSLLSMWIWTKPPKKCKNNRKKMLDCVNYKRL